MVAAIVEVSPCPSGFYMDEGSIVCLPYPSTISDPPKLSTGEAIGIGIAIGVCVSAVIMMLLFVIMRKKRRSHKNDIIVVTKPDREEAAPVEQLARDDPSKLPRYWQ